MKGFGRHFPESISASEEAMDLMKNLMMKNVANRLTSVEALDHKWFRNASSNRVISAQVIASLTSLSKISKFKLTILEVFKDVIISDEKRQTLRKTFDEMDQDKNGTVSLSEFKNTMLKFGTMTEKVAERIFKRADFNQDSVVSFDELLLTVTDHQLRNVNERMYKMFLLIDENGDGSLSPDEIKRYFEKTLKDDPIINQMGLLADIEKNVEERIKMVMVKF